MKKVSISLSQIAKEAGVSCGLVSSLFSNNTYRNGGGIGIAPETEDRIIRASRKLGYIPKDLAMRLKIYPDFGCFGFLISNMSRSGFAPFYSELMFGAYDNINSTEVNFSIGSFDGNCDFLNEPQKMPFCTTDNHTSKFMFAGSVNYSLLLALKKRGSSIVYFLREVDIEGVTSIVPDFENAGYLGVKHLLEHGHREIAVAAEHYFKELSYCTTYILKGIKHALEEAGLPFENDEVAYNNSTDPAASDCFGQLQSRGKKYTAIFCLCDYTALRVMNSISSAGLRVPEDISIVGCNNQSFSVNLNPPLTSIDLNLREIGKCGAEILNTPERKHKSLYEFPVRLVERKSVINLNK